MHVLFLGVFKSFFLTLGISPGDSISDSGRGLGGPCVQLVSFLGDVLLRSRTRIIYRGQEDTPSDD